MHNGSKLCMHNGSKLCKHNGFKSSIHNGSELYPNHLLLIVAIYTGIMLMMQNPYFRCFQHILDVSYFIKFAASLHQLGCKIHIDGINVVKIRKWNTEHDQLCSGLIINCNTYVCSILYKSNKADARLNITSQTELSANIGTTQNMYWIHTAGVQYQRIFNCIWFGMWLSLWLS